MKLYVEINSEIYLYGTSYSSLSIFSVSSKNTDGQNQQTFTKSPRYVQTLYNALCTNASFKLQTSHSNAIEKLFIPSHEKYHSHIYIVKFALSILCIIFHFYLYISHTLAYGVIKKLYI